MSVYHRMLGRELPCNVAEMLGICPVQADDHETLIQQVELGAVSADALHRLGLSHLARQELGLAQRRLEAAVAAAPRASQARLALAAVCGLLARHDRAVEQIDAAVAEGLTRDAVGLSPPTRYALDCAAGFCLERSGRTGAAVFRYREALAHEPTDLFAHQRLAAIFLAHCEPQLAAEHHRAILQQHPQDAAARTSLANLLQGLGRHEEAVWEYEKALCLEPDNWDSQADAVDQLQRAGSIEEAIRVLRGLVQKQPQFPDLRLRLANLHSTRGDDTDAMLHYAKALTAHPNYLECHIALARHELRMGRDEAAADHFQQAICVNNQTIEAYAGLATALRARGHADRAAETIAAAGKVANNSDVLLAQLGLLEMRHHAAEDAGGPSGAEDAALPDDPENFAECVEHQIARYGLILQDHPAWTDIRVRQGMLLKLAGRRDEAARQFSRAAETDPACAGAWLQLGLCLHQAGDQAASHRALEASLRLRPESAALHYRLALIYCSGLEYDLTLERLEQAEEISCDSDLDRHLWGALQDLQVTTERRSSRHIPRKEMTKHETRMTNQ